MALSHITGSSSNSTLTGAATEALILATLNSQNIQLTPNGSGFTAVTAGDLDVGSAAVGTPRTVQVLNSDNTNAASGARLAAVSGGSAGGDAYTLFSIAGAQNWVIGIDNSDSDALVISAGSALGTTNALRLDVSTQGMKLYAALNMQGARINNVLAASAGTDAVNLTQATALVAAPAIGVEVIKSINANTFANINAGVTILAANASRTLVVTDFILQVTDTAFTGAGTGTVQLVDEGGNVYLQITAAQIIALGTQSRILFNLTGVQFASATNNSALSVIITGGTFLTGSWNAVLKYNFTN